MGQLASIEPATGPGAPPDGCYVDLYWMPVGAGTPAAQRFSLAFWEALEAARARRPRTTLYHSALKVRRSDGTRWTVELTPVAKTDPVTRAECGPVGSPLAARWRLFRYQVRCVEAEHLPDEQWAAGKPLRLLETCEQIETLFARIPEIPLFTWGRHIRGAREMWTSDSAIAWLLAECGVAVEQIALPEGGRAPGWSAGIAHARRTGANRRTRAAG